MEAVELHPSGIDADHAATVAIYRVFSAPDLKAVQVVIAPTEGDLQCLVELRHRAVGPDEKPPPYQRADAAQDHPQLKNLRFRTTRFHHPASLLLCAAHPQLSVGLKDLCTISSKRTVKINPVTMFAVAGM